MKLCDVIRHFRSDTKWEVIFIKRTQYETSYKLSCLSRKMTVYKNDTELDAYKYDNGDWVVPRNTTGHYYTDDQKKFLADNYGIMKIGRIAEIMGKSESTLYNMAAKLKSQGVEFKKYKKRGGC